MFAPRVPLRIFSCYTMLEGGGALVATHNERSAAGMGRVLRFHEGRLE